jgi:hypothetical protein
VNPDLVDRLLRPKLGEIRVHPAVYAEIKRGDHNKVLEEIMQKAWGEFDVIVTTEIPADRVVFVSNDAGVQMVIMLDPEDNELAEIMRLRRELTEALANESNESP